MKKIVSIALIAVLIVSCFTFAASAESKVSVRIEGKEDTFYVGNVAIKEDSTVLDVVKTIEATDDNVVSLNITESQYGAYVSGINGEKEVTENVLDDKGEVKATYYIGWMFAVDNQNATVGVSDYKLKGGENIVLYYADMNAQVPVADFSEKGKIKLTSYNWLPDWSGMEWQPASGVAVTLNDKEYTSDSDGVVAYNPADFEGFVKVQVKGADELGYPTVCRFASDYGFDISKLPDAVTSEAAASEIAASETATSETAASEAAASETATSESAASEIATSEAAPDQPEYVLVKNKINLYVKETYQIKITTDEKVKYYSNNKKYVTVSSKGKITALKAGSATIKVKAGDTIMSISVKVKNPKLNASKKTLKKGKSFALKVTGAVGKVKYSSSKKAVAAVSSKGKVTAKKKGTSVISVKASGMTLKCKVTVK